MVFVVAYYERETKQMMQLKDSSLFIADAFIDGEWVSKDKKFDVFGK
jgi:succinate-semialdehyde dehydrogenase/glutarate-semialdehyde dehydrogenase